MEEEGIGSKRDVEARLGAIETQIRVLVADHNAEEMRPATFAIIKTLEQHRVSMEELWEEPMEIMLKFFLGFVKLAIVADFVLPVVALIFYISLGWIAARTLVVMFGVLVYDIVQLGLLVYRKVPRPAWNGFVGFWGHLIDKIVTLRVPLPCLLVSMINVIEDTVDALKIAVQRVEQFAKDVASSVAELADTVAHEVADIWDKVSHFAGNAASSIWHGITGIFGRRRRLLAYQGGAPARMGILNEEAMRRMEVVSVWDDDDRHDHHLNRAFAASGGDAAVLAQTAGLPHHLAKTMVIGLVLSCGGRECTNAHPKPFSVRPGQRVTGFVSFAGNDHHLLARPHFGDSLDGLGSALGAFTRHALSGHSVSRGRAPEGYTLRAHPSDLSHNVTEMLRCMHTTTVHTWPGVLTANTASAYTARKRRVFNGVRHTFDSEAGFCEAAAVHGGVSSECLALCAQRAELHSNGTTVPGGRRLLQAVGASEDKRCPNNKHDVPDSINLGNVFKFMQALRIRSRFGDTTANDWDWLRRMRMCGCDYFTSGSRVLGYFIRKLLSPYTCKFGRGLRATRPFVRDAFESVLSWTLLHDRRHNETVCENIARASALMVSGAYNSITLGFGHIRAWEYNEPAPTFDTCVTEPTGIETYCSIWGVGFMLIYLSAVMVVGAVLVCFFDMFLAVFKFGIVIYRIFVLNFIISVVLAVMTFVIQYEVDIDTRRDILLAHGVVLENVGDAFTLMYSTETRGVFRTVGSCCKVAFMPFTMCFDVVRFSINWCAYVCNCCKRRSLRKGALVPHHNSQVHGDTGVARHMQTVVNHPHRESSLFKEIPRA